MSEISESVRRIEVLVVFGGGCTWSCEALEVDVVKIVSSHTRSFICPAQSKWLFHVQS